MVEVSVAELLWLSVEPYGEQMQIDQKKLAELCIQELVNNAAHLTLYLPRLPNQIHSMIMSSAIGQNNAFVVKELMKWCPYEAISLPVPNVLKTLHAISHNAHINEEEMVNVYADFTRLAAEMLPVFFNIIENNDTGSQLRCLDFCNIPVGLEVFILLKDFLSRVTTVLARQYTLKCAAVVSKSTDIYMLTYCIQKANDIGFKLIITGIFFFNNYYPDITIINLLEHLNELDVELIGFKFSILLPSIEPICDVLHSFKYMKYLNISYLVDVSSEALLKALASALVEFQFLKRLALRGIILTNRLSRLFQEFCKKNHEKEANSKCCILHNGTLEYLDISSCKLIGEDIDILRELALKRSLKYLNININSLALRSTCETLLSLKSSLNVLEMDRCFHGQVEYDPMIFPISEFKELKYLSMKGLNMTQRSIASLESERLKLPKLVITVT